MAEREVSAVKEWEKELYIYRLSPAPPKKDDFQEYIDLYFAENDEKYLMWFLHYYEPVLNDTVTDIVQRYAMYGHFADIKQECVSGIYKALKSYNKSKDGQFITYKVRIMWNEVHNYIRTMRTGFSGSSQTTYRNLRKIMHLYYRYGSSNEAISKITEEVKRSEQYVSEIITAGLESTNIVDFYRKYADEDDDTQDDVTTDYTTEPLGILMRIELHKLLKEAFAKLGYREREMIYSHLGLCPECLRFTKKSKTYQEIAVENELTSAQAAENEVNRAYEKLRKYIKSNW
mgnify:FL=1